MVKPGALEFAPGFENPEIHQAAVGMEEKLPWHIQLTANAEVSLGRRLPSTVDTNYDPALNPGELTYEVIDTNGKGPIRTPQLTVPFYATWPSATSATHHAGRANADYQQIVQIASRANSTYEAATVRVDRYATRGIGFHFHYIYGHAMDWNPNESTQLGSNVFDPADFRLEYGTSDQDVRHTAAGYVVLRSPSKLGGLGGKLARDWNLAGVGQFRSGMPYTMRTTGQLAREYQEASGLLAVALGPGMNGSGGDNRVYGVGRNSFRYPQTWRADLRLSRRFRLGQMRELELLAESFNLFNHRNVTELETIGYTIGGGALAGSRPTLTWSSGEKANTTAFGAPLNVNATNFFRERQIQLGLKLRF